MTDELDLFLAEALRPAEREPDRAFVARVQARIRLDEQVRAERSRALSLLARQVVGLAAVAAGAIWLARSPAIAGFAGESPAILLLALLAAFSFVILLFSSEGPSKSPQQAFSNT
jgi:hypothetical protein